MIFTKTRDDAPVWLSHRSWSKINLPVALRRWLLDPSSLTDQLKRACDGNFKVRVIDEFWAKPRVDEMRVLGMRAGTIARIRQVQLLCNDRPSVFARTVIPSSTLSGKQRRLAYLGNKPLGAYLFADPYMKRGEVELACIRPGQATFSEATSGSKRKPNNIWGRRSVFRIGGKPLLVSEVFLPGLPARKSR